MRVENLIFDLDGTLVNSLPGIEYSVGIALSERSLPAYPGDLRSLIGPPIRNILSTVGRQSEGLELNALEQAFRRSYDSNGWLKTLLFDGAYALLDKANRAGIRMFIATNKPAKATEMILSETRIRPFFQEVVCRDSTEPPFPSKAAMLLSLIERHHFNLGASLFVGDTSEDLEAGGFGWAENCPDDPRLRRTWLKRPLRLSARESFQELPVDEQGKL